MSEKTDLLELVSIISKNRDTLDSIAAALETALEHDIPKLGRTASAALIPAGFLENYYTCLQTIMLRISQHFESHLDPARWHADLLQKMTIRIEDTRVELIDDETYPRLVELEKFRHFRRYYFEMEYDWDRIDYLVLVLRKAHPKVLSGIGRFLQFLRALL